MNQSADRHSKTSLYPVMLNSNYSNSSTQEASNQNNEANNEMDENDPSCGCSTGTEC
jgi:hypothetical protein